MPAPRNPAPVSGPGNTARRTDGGAGQPISAAPAEHYGQRKQMEQAQQAAPMASGSPFPNAFGPTTRPGEPQTAGLPFGPGAGPVPDTAGNPDMLLAELARKYPHPDLLRLLARRGQ